MEAELADGEVSQMLMTCLMANSTLNFSVCETTYLVVPLFSYANKNVLLEPVWFEFSTNATK